MDKMFVFVHTVTITYRDYEISAQFYHGMAPEQDRDEEHGNRLMFKLLGKRVAIHSRRGVTALPILGKVVGEKHRMLTNGGVQRRTKLCVKSMKRGTIIRHMLRPIHFGSRNNFMGNGLMSQSYVKGEETSISSPTNLSMTQSCSNSPILQENKPQNNNRSHLVGNLTLQSSADDTINWLTNNRFTAYLNTFQSFSGSDILRLSRDDLIQICGLADGIRLYNALHAKIITPKLTLYVCTERSTMFHAIYLNSYTNIELGEKLSPLVQASAEQIQGYFLQGPNGIHIHINDEVIRHFKNEQMYTVEISPDMNMNTCRVILKPLNP